MNYDIENLYYEGIFFDEENIKKIREKEMTHLEKAYQDLHITFKFKPTKEELMDGIVGKQFSLKLIGYGCDGTNSGFQIELPKELYPYYINYDETKKLKTPHITVSLSENASAVDTQKLDFKPLKTPIEVSGKFGYCYIVSGKRYVSFEKLNINENNKRMNKQELLDLIKNTKINPTEFTILSSSALVLRNIYPDSGDLDIAVTKKGLEELQQSYNLKQKENGWYIVNDKVECILDDMQNKKELLNGYYLQEINDYLKYLQSSNREKDKIRIPIVEKYIQNRK